MSNTKPIVFIFVAIVLLTYILVIFYSNKDGENQLNNQRYKQFIDLNLYSYESAPIRSDFDLQSLLDYPNEYIYAYVNLPLDYYYGSNSIPLALAALISPPGDFLELGMGLFSTPLLHKIAHQQKRHLYSVDTDLDWMNKFIIYNATLEHKMYHLKSKNDINKYGLETNWSLVLVDHIYAELRPLNVIAFAQKAQIVVAHDTEKQNEYIYLYDKNKMTGNFKYVCKFTLFRAKKGEYISTTLMSNFIDLEAILTPVFNKVKTDFGHSACDINF